MGFDLSKLSREQLEKLIIEQVKKNDSLGMENNSLTKENETLVKKNNLFTLEKAQLVRNLDRAKAK